jgi:hypothetical protein
VDIDLYRRKHLRYELDISIANSISLIC